MEIFKGLTEKLNKLWVKDGNEEQKKKERMFKVIEEARKEWEDAHNLFEHVEDPDLVDYVIYTMQAAEKKYVYLYKQAKCYGILEFKTTADNLPMHF